MAGRAEWVGWGGRRRTIGVEGLCLGAGLHDLDEARGEVVVLAQQVAEQLRRVRVRQQRPCAPATGIPAASPIVVSQTNKLPAL